MRFALPAAPSPAVLLALLAACRELERAGAEQITAPGSGTDLRSTLRLVTSMSVFWRMWVALDALFAGRATTTHSHIMLTACGATRPRTGAPVITTGWCDTAAAVRTRPIGETQPLSGGGLLASI